MSGAQVERISLASICFGLMSRAKYRAASAAAVRSVVALVPWLLGAWIIFAAGHSGAPWLLHWIQSVTKPRHTLTDLLAAAPLEIMLAIVVHVAIATTVAAILTCPNALVSACLVLATFCLLGADLLSEAWNPHSRLSEGVMLLTAVPFFLGWSACFVGCVALAIVTWRKRKRLQVQP